MDALTKARSNTAELVDPQQAERMLEDTRRKSKTISTDPKKDATPEKRVNGDSLRSPSKFTPLLTRSQRADSFKGSFQLRLMSSDHPDAQTPMRESVTKKESTPVQEEAVGTDVQISVIIPPKNEINQFTQSIIDKFYENQEDQKKSLEKLMRVLSNFPWITKEDFAKLEYLYENVRTSFLLNKF